MKRLNYWIVAIIGLLVAVVALLFHEQSWLFTLGTIELVLIGLVVNTFVIVYARRKWKSNPYGRALMYSKVSLAVLVDLSLLTIAFGPDWEWRAFLRVILFGLVLVAQTRLLQLLFSLRNSEAREIYNEKHDSAGREI
jgi:hypothetical protein